MRLVLIRLLSALIALGLTTPSFAQSAQVDVVDADTISFNFNSISLPSPQPNGGGSIIYISLPSSSIAGISAVSGSALFGNQTVNSGSTGSYAKPYDYPIALEVPNNLAVGDILSGTLTVDFNAPHGVTQSQFDGAGMDVSWGRYWVGAPTNWAANKIGTAVSGIIPSITATTAPTSLVTTVSDGRVSIAFTAPSNNGGSAIIDYEYQLDSGAWVSASTATTPVVITGLTNGTAYSIKLRTVNGAGGGAESAAVHVQLGSAAAEFEASKDAIRSIIANDTQRSLGSALASNKRLTRDARGRFLTSRTQMPSDDAGTISRNNIALDVDGIAVASAEQIATQGMFFAQTGNSEGTQRRLMFGDFDVQRNADTGSTTATINGKIAWEQMLSEQTMLGYYLGGAVSRSDIKGSFAGTQDKYGVSVGGYFVHALQDNLFLDGFASLGASRNDLEMADDTLNLKGDYTTRTVTLGAAVSGVIEQSGYDFLPEVSFNYGKTSIGDVGFTGGAYGLKDNTLSLDAGSASTATIMFRPEFQVPVGVMAVSKSNAMFSFAPRLICERVKVTNTANNCGGGAEIGLMYNSTDGRTSANATLIADRVTNSRRSSLQFKLERQF